MNRPTLAPGTFAPRPGRAGAVAMTRSAALQELRVTVRNGEQLLLAFIIPVGALVAMTIADVTSIAEPRIATVAPGILALAVMSAAFTSQAIVTGFDRRYGVLKRLAATGFPRWLLVAAKCTATMAVVVGQYVVLFTVAVFALGWRPVGHGAWVVLLTVEGVAAFIGLALLIGGTLRAEAVLGVANLVWLLLVGIGGVLVPLATAPSWLRVIGELTPAGALSVGLRDVLTDGGAPAVTCVMVLAAWILLGWAGAVRWFRWQ